MENLFVPYDLAVTLKEKGLKRQLNPSGDLTGYNMKRDNKRITYYHVHTQFPSVDEFQYAPMYQQVTDWLREKYNIHIHISRTYTYIGELPRTFDGWCVYIDNGTEERADINSYFVQNFFETYYVALRRAIEESLKLI